MRLVLTANVISMVGSGMNSAAVSWYILQATHSEIALGSLILLQTIPTLLLAPFSGVIIDREDRRRLVMLLDAGRALVILLVAVLALQHRAQLWHLYVMNMLVATGFWMFWPTVNALIQELAPSTHFVHANTLFMAGVQGGWLISGAVVGFIYNHIGLGGVLLIDFSSYLLSMLCYFGVRKGRHVVHRPPELRQEVVRIEGAAARFVHETREGIQYLRGNVYVLLLGASSALLLGAMLAQNAINAPLVDRVLHAGAVGFGWINAGWGIGAFISVMFVPVLMRRFGARATVVVCMALIAGATFLAPFFSALAVAVLLFLVMGASRGVAGVAINTGLMETVPRHYMGRVQSTFAFAGRSLQMSLGMGVGFVAQRYSLTAAFFIIGAAYFAGCLTAAAAQPRRQPAPEAAFHQAGGAG